MASKAHLNEDTKKIWSEKLGRQITDEEAAAIEEIFIKFFDALLEEIDK